MSWTKERCACVAVNDSIDFLDESNSTRHVIMLPATKSNQTGQEDKQWPFTLYPPVCLIFSACEDVYRHATERDHQERLQLHVSITLAKRWRGNNAAGFLTGYVGVGRCASGTCRRRGRQDGPPCDCTWP